MEKLIYGNRNTIGNKPTDEMLALTDNAAFLTATVRYAILTNMLILSKNTNMARQVFYTLSREC